MRDGRKGIAQKEQGNDLEFAIKINRGKLDSRKAGFAEFFRTRYRVRWWDGCVITINFLRSKKFVSLS